MKKEKSVRKAEWKAAVIKKLKSLTVPVILSAIIIGGIVFVVNYQGAEEEEKIIEIRGYEGDDKPLVMENEKLKFVMDPITTQFSLEVKDTGMVWYSNPEGGANDPIALTAEKGRLQSTLSMSYCVNTGLESSLNNYDYSIKNGVYEIEAGEDYIRVDYSIGDLEREYVIPPAITEAKMDTWLAAMSKDGMNMVKSYYKLYDINKLGKKDDKEALLEAYPILAEEPIYVLRDGTKEPLKIKMEEHFASAGYTYEDYLEDKEMNSGSSGTDKPVFNVSMIYRLDGGDLVVEVPLQDLEFKEEYPIYTITPLPYFGAGGTEDEGYMLVPEGGGAVINFNNGKISQNSYHANLYGWDMALSREAVVHNTRAYFNTFGIARDGNSFLCILEEGAPYASVKADISGHLNSFNFVNAVYSICVGEQYDVSEIANSSVYVFLEELPDETLTQRYRFADSDSYVDMAKVYQGYLKDIYGDDFAMNDDTEAPVTIEIVGAVDKVKQILGVPVSRPLKLTTYSEAEEMIKELQSEGMNNMSVKLTGWCNGGVNQQILNRIHTISALGSKKDLRNMVSTAESLGVDVYLEGITQYAYDSNLLDGFFSYTDAAKFISKERAELFIYSDVTYSAREGIDSYYLLKPEIALQMAENLSEKASEFGAGVAFKDTGMDLSSDYYKKAPVSRQEMLNLQAEQLKAMSDSGQNICINMGNEYAAVYSDMITNMDLRGSEYTILDEFVPFYQLAIHGYLNYTGTALNITGNAEEELLKAAEYGAGLQFNLMRETAFALQKTLYTEYYGSDYAQWHDRMMEIYTRYNAELGHTFNQEMTNHQCITGELSCTTYDDGTKVYVNYGYAEAVTPDGVTVPARDYKVVR